MRLRICVGLLVLASCSDPSADVGADPPSASDAQAEAAARAVLGNPGDLRLSSVRHSLTGDHVRFVQLAPDGTPIAESEISVHLGGQGKHPRTQRVFDGAVRPTRLVGARRLGEGDAGARAVAAVGGGTVDEATQVAIPVGGGDLRPGWRVLVRVLQPAALWDVWVDADDGHTEVRRDLLQHATGYVFRPNAVTSTGNTTLTDNNNATNATLDGARFLVTLTDLDGSGFLRGTYVDSQPGTGTRTQSASGMFLFDRSQTGFEETNAYFHITNGNHNLQSLGFTGASAILNLSLPVFVDDGPADNSFYDPIKKQIHYGAGGVDDAEDGDVVLHEYGHAILDNIVPGFGAGGDAGGMGEGFGDIDAVSTPTGGPDLVTRACVAPWDATSYSTTNPPCLRRVDGQKHYPEFLDGEVHDDGEIWSGAIWEMYQTTGLGPTTGYKLVVEAVFSVTATTTYPQYAQAVLDADTALYSGAHIDAIKRAFWKHGIWQEVLPPAPFTGTIQTVAANIAPASPIPNLSDAQATLQQPGASAMRVHFASFNLRNGDNVYLFDGTGHLYGKLTGNLGASNAPPIPGGTVVVRWVTNSSQTSTGFHVDSYDYIAGGATMPDAGTPDATPPPPDAAPGTPDAAPPPPDATPPAPDATPRPPDAAVVGGRADAAPTMPKSPDSGCGCHVGGAAPGTPWGLAALTLLGVTLLHRRRSRRN